MLTGDTIVTISILVVSVGNVVYSCPVNVLKFRCAHSSLAKDTERRFL